MITKIYVPCSAKKEIYNAILTLIDGAVARAFPFQKIIKKKIRECPSNNCKIASRAIEQFVIENKSFGNNKYVHPKLAVSSGMKTTRPQHHHSHHHHRVIIFSISLT